jgi:hypothetical protein
MAPDVDVAVVPAFDLTLGSLFLLALVLATDAVAEESAAFVSFFASSPLFGSAAGGLERALDEETTDSSVVGSSVLT